MPSRMFSDIYETYNCEDYEVYEDFEDIDTTSNTWNYGAYDSEEYFTDGYNYRYTPQVKPIPRTTEILPFKSNYVYSIKIKKFEPDPKIVESVETDGEQEETWEAFEKERLYFGSRIQRLKLNDKREIEDPTKEDRYTSVNERVSKIWDETSVKPTEEPTSVPAVTAVYVPPRLRNKGNKEAPNIASLVFFPTLGTDESEINCTIKRMNEENEGFTEIRSRRSILANNRPMRNHPDMISDNVPPSLTGSRKMERPGRFTDENRSSFGNYVPPTVRSRQSSEQFAHYYKFTDENRFTDETRSSRENYVPPTVKSRQSDEQTAARAHINERTVISANRPPSLTRSKQMEGSVRFADENRSSGGIYIPPTVRSRQSSKPAAKGHVNVKNRLSKKGLFLEDSLHGSFELKYSRLRCSMS
ncbi:hypothetical protein QYM36_011587 [Artemia franciscana]|uniref:Uncharacterized protein n=1 Tax=Artemia franciscana TaxID=6661 RepID=A0AA88HXR6_ARTSF|nr:hypothetical protein QYM36_011587 [Artemia franciscana]